jgi:dephospho-CoA kinase
MKIIAFTGMPCSGKSEAVRVAREKGMWVVRIGDLVWGETKKQGLELNDRNVGLVAEEMRRKHGKDIWARKTVDLIKSREGVDFVVVDGIRNVEEVDRFKKELTEDFTVIAIDASDELRKKRALSRGREDDSRDLRDFVERDMREIRWGIGEVIASADIVISNEGSLDAFRRKVERVLSRLR